MNNKASRLFRDDLLLEDNGMFESYAGLKNLAEGGQCNGNALKRIRSFPLFYALENKQRGF
jgi:hypothetical protein